MNNSRISSPTIQGTAICHAGMVKEEAGQPAREMTECSIWRPLSRFTQLSATTHDYKSLHVIAICTECTFTTYYLHSRAGELATSISADRLLSFT